MDKKFLVQELRERQISLGKVEENIVNSLSDDDIIDSYITCSNCGEKEITDDVLLNSLIKNAENAEDFFIMLDELKNDK